MHKVVILVTLLSLTAGTTVAQKSGVQVGLKAGLNLAVLDHTINQNNEFKAGPLFGAFLRWKPAAHFALQPELMYSAQGTKYILPARPADLTGKTNLTYLNLPVLAKIYLGKVFNVQLGPQVGLLLAGREKGESGYITPDGNLAVRMVDADVKQDYKSDVAVCGGLGLDLPNGLVASLRLNYGFSNINNNENQQQFRDYYGLKGLHNRAFQFSVGYAFGSK